MLHPADFALGVFDARIYDFRRQFAERSDTEHGEKLFHFFGRRELVKLAGQLFVCLLLSVS